MVLLENKALRVMEGMTKSKTRCQTTDGMLYLLWIRGEVLNDVSKGALWLGVHPAEIIRAAE